jgi:hypothetical protein
MDGASLVMAHQLAVASEHFTPQKREEVRDFLKSSSADNITREEKDNIRTALWKLDGHDMYVQMNGELTKQIGKQSELMEKLSKDKKKSFPTKRDLLNIIFGSLPVAGIILLGAYLFSSSKNGK